MSEQDGITLVYTGSSIDANYLEGLLEENGIVGMIRDVLNESTVGGWGAGSPENACHLFVTDEDAPAALRIIEEYMNTRSDLPEEEN